MWALERAGGRCEVTVSGHAHGGPLDVHHLTYDHLWAEQPADVVVYCRTHHEIADGRRSKRSWWRRLLFGRGHERNP